MTKYNNLDVYFHMRNHYRKILNAKPVVDTASPQTYHQTTGTPSTSSTPGPAKLTQKEYYALKTAHYPYHSLGLIKHCCLNEEAPRPVTRRHPNDMPNLHGAHESPPKAHGVIGTSRDYAHFSEFYEIPTEITTNIVPTIIGIDSIYDKIESKKKTQLRGGECDFKCCEGCKTCSRPSEHEYLQFALRITEDILKNDLYTNSEIKRVFNSHIEANLGRLDEGRMRQQINQLALELNLSFDNIQSHSVQSMHADPKETFCECNPWESADRYTCALHTQEEIVRSLASSEGSDGEMKDHNNPKHYNGHHRHRKKVIRKPIRQMVMDMKSHLNSEVQLTSSDKEKADVPSTLNALSLNNWDDDVHSAPDFYSQHRGDFAKSEKNSECDANDSSTTRDESKCDESLETVERRSDTNHHSNSKNLHSKKVKKRRSVDKATKGAKEGDHLKSKKAVGLETEVHKLRNRREHHTKTHSKAPKGRSAAKVLETSQEPTATCKDLTLSNPSLFENVPETSSPTFEQLVPPNSSPVEKVLGTNSLTSKQLAPPKPSPLEKASGKSSAASKQLAPSKLSPFEKESKTGSPASKQLASSKPLSFEKASGTSSPTSKRLASSKPSSFEKTSGTNPKPPAINAKQSTQTPKQIAIPQQCMTSPKTSFVTPNQNGEADVLKSTEIVQILSKLSEEVLMNSNTNQSINIESKNASNVSINRHDKKHGHGHRKRKEKKRTRSHSDNRIREHRHHRKGGSKSSISSDRGALDIETKSLQSNGSIMSPVQKKADETIGLHSGRTTQRVDNRSNKSIQSVRGSPERFSVNSAEFGTNVNAGTQNPIPSLEEDAMSCSCKLHSRVPTATLSNQTAAMYSTVGKDENQSFKQLQNGYFILPGPVYVMQQAVGTLPPPVVPYNPPGLKTIKVVPTIEQKAAEQNINANSIVQSKEKDKCIQTKPKKSVCLCPPRSLPKKKCNLKTCFAFKNSREDLLLSEEYDNEMPPSITQFFPTAATQTTSSEFIMISRILSVYAQNVQDTESESKSERQIKSTILDPSMRVISSTNEKQNKKRKTKTVSEVESSLKRAANELQALLSGKAIDNIAKLSTHIENISEVDEEAKDHLDRVVSLQSSTKLTCQIEMQKKRDLEELPEEEEGIQEPDVTKQSNVVVGTNVMTQPNVVVGSGVTKQPKVMMESDVTKQPNVVVGPDVTDDPIEISKSTPYAAQSLGNNREDTLIGSASIDLDDNISDDLGIKRVTRSVAERNTSRVFSSSKRVDESEGDDFMKKLDTVPARMSMTTSMEQRIKKVVHESEMFRHPEDKGAGWTNNVGGIDIADISSSESSEEDEQQMWAQQDTEDPRGFHSKYSVHETPKMKRLEETTTVGAADSSSAGILEGKD